MSDLPRELVLASAGSGKTYRISSAIIALLEAGEEPERILAATFARKAAGEILGRVLERLAEGALQDDKAGELSRTALLPGRPSPAGRERWLALLLALVRRLHRTSVGTLDSFFVRAAASFSAELGLPPAWSIADEPTALRLETEALQDVLVSQDRGAIVELVRALMRGDTTRAVQDRLLQQAGDLREILHEVDPAAERPWAPFREEGGPPTDEEREAAARILEGLDVPLNKNGTPNRNWAKDLPRAAAAVRAGRWEELVGKGVAAKLVAGEDAYSQRPIPPEAGAAFDAALKLARRDLADDFARQTRAMERLGRMFDGALAARQRGEGAYGFQDVTRLLGGDEGVIARPDLWYRLDQRARHLLLDEFQDTSVAQWLALRPLAEELLSGHREERAAVVVADPKQSIYGWRGAEPELVDRIGAGFALDRETMRFSWRSSEVVLRFVNRVFSDLPGNPVWDDPKRPELGEADREVATAWHRYFEPHAPARTGKDALAGYVRVEAGPRDDGIPNRTDRPLLMRRAAEVVARIREESPDASVGVLTRSNQGVARVIAELGRLEVRASEEGGTRLTDSAAVVAALALLRLADHPGHTIARYHVARSPFGDVLDFRDWNDDRAAERLSRRVRRRLVREGYGAPLDDWTRALDEAGALGVRDAHRMDQLVEAGFRWDARSTLRPGDFVRYVEAERVEDPASARVRVMTVHRAKGLEFDVVVLPELDALLRKGGGGPPALPERDPATSRIVRVFPYVKKAFRPLFPEVEAAYRQHRASQLRDALGVLYVGLTRARHAVHVLVAADEPGKEPASAATHARLLREALGRHHRAFQEGEVLFEDGDRHWYAVARPREEPARQDDGRLPVPSAPSDVRLASRPRTRVLPHRAPSDLESGGRVDLSRLLSLDPGAEGARRTGTVVHEWCRRLGWLDDDGVPGDDELLGAARRIAPEMEEGGLRELLGSFRSWVEAEPVRRALSRGGLGPGPAPPTEHLELRREVPFAVRLDDGIVRGAIDRLVLERSPDGRVLRAGVLDFKTDESSDLDAAVERYRPQIDAYRRAARRMFGLESADVTAALVFLRPGIVREV